MAEIHASNINLRGADNQMVPLSQWTFGDFVANLVGGYLVDGYQFHLTKENDLLTLTAVGVETGDSFELATSGTSSDENTTYKLKYENNVLTFSGSDGTETSFNINSDSGIDKDTTYTLAFDETTNELVFKSSDEEVEDTKIKINTSQNLEFLNDQDFLTALVSA